MMKYFYRISLFFQSMGIIFCEKVGCPAFPLKRKTVKTRQKLASYEGSSQERYNRKMLLK